ncbi:MAG: DEAD/DEAH box helicase [Caldilineaceae bacterium]
MRQRSRKDALPIERYSEAEAAQRLRRIVSPFILRRVKTDPTVIQDLPESRKANSARCHTERATLYEAVVQDALHTIESAEDEMKRRGLVLSMLMKKLKQICNHPARFLHQLEGDAAAEKTATRSGKVLAKWWKNCSTPATAA